MTVPFLVDCDTGIDDAIALSYLAAHPQAEIAGIVSTGGNVAVTAVHRNNLVLAELLGVDAPIARGADRPLVQEPMFADDTHGPGGLGHAVLPESAHPGDPRTGAQLWVDLARARPGELVGLVLGPHTNLALALEIEPELPHLLRRLHFMGGAINHRGNTGPTSEWNIAVDPEAAQRVLSAFTGAAQRPVMGSLEATETVRFTQDTLDRVTELATDGGHPIARILVEALRFYFEFHQADGFGWMAHVHDPLVTAHAVTGDFASTRPLAVDVELAGTLTRGQTVGDELGRWGRAPNLEVLTEVRPDEFVEHLLETLRAGLGRLSDPAWSPRP
ncbi:nucleoside hydrolase [Brachybacterium vulturis]|uniref:Nucleoside hydrolase n=1 Tax=Brachybacterium vulturis TaxID=2017484 RepID=A0A291GML1_9MICO|nr:nucleoside hydrolase [Brachybacterium vulturis]ATG51312.1 nucleoside hydrolase [Brachybacterium vulturis]